MGSSKILNAVLPQSCPRLVSLNVIGSSIRPLGVARLVEPLMIASQGLFGLQRIWIDDPDIVVPSSTSPQITPADMRAYYFLQFRGLVVDPEYERWRRCRENGIAYSTIPQERQLEPVYL